MREVCNAEWDDIQDRLKEKDAEIERLAQVVSELKAVIWACAGIFVHRTPVTISFIRELEEISRL